MLLTDLLFPNRCLGCNRIISAEELVCGLCFDKINLLIILFRKNNFLKELCSVLFPVEHAYALMKLKKTVLVEKLLISLNTASGKKSGKL